MSQSRNQAYFLVLVAALGYFVDIYDIVLFAILRQPSLADLGVPASSALEVGVRLVNWQMTGMLVGGIAWGVLGDKLGRRSVLFGSILLYSIANIANGMVDSIGAYVAWRLIAGIGLAGELGAGITLVTEMLPKDVRGWGTTVVATIGICGAVVAAQVGAAFPWRTAYFIGGGLGLGLLALRIGVLESGMFARLKSQAIRRGEFLALFATRERIVRYVATILTGLPIWFVVGVLVFFAPEVGGVLGLDPAPTAGRAVMWCYVGLAIGDLASGALSQWLRSRKRVVRIFLLLTTCAIVTYFVAGRAGLGTFYACCTLLGVSTGYWAVFVTMASEQFGTNLRATVTTTAPNFVRGAMVPGTLALKALKAPLGLVGSAALVGGVTLALAFLGLSLLDETFDKDLDFVEPI